jgi:hypothetical protein
MHDFYTNLGDTSLYELLEEGKIKTTALGGIYINMRFLYRMV